MRTPTTIAAASKALASFAATAMLLAATTTGSAWAATSCTASDPTGTPPDPHMGREVSRQEFPDTCVELKRVGGILISSPRLVMF
jgi:hypothetical protein